MAKVKPSGRTTPNSALQSELGVPKIEFQMTEPVPLHLPQSIQYDQSRLTLCDPMDCSPPGPSVHGILERPEGGPERTPQQAQCCVPLPCPHPWAGASLWLPLPPAPLSPLAEAPFPPTMSGHPVDRLGVGQLPQRVQADVFWPFQ